MWELIKIEARNICAFRELAYVLCQGVTTLVFGDNRDNESQRSNGSGKSALIEAIVLGLTGSPLRKVRAEEIINDAAEECVVLLTLSNSMTGEKMEIEREVYRKGASRVQVSINNEGKQVDIALPGVDAYNKFILERLGVTRDELFNNFILSRHRYQDFLSASDREKKEIINRFSNGNLVDQAIERITEDIVPLQNDVNVETMELAGLDGRIQMLNEQIAEQENQSEQNKRTKAERIDTMLASVTEKRNLIRVRGCEITSLEENERLVEMAEKRAQQIENSDTSLSECLGILESLLSPLSDQKMTDWQDVVETKRRELSDAEEDVKKWDVMMGDISKRIGTITADGLHLKSEYDVFCDSYRLRCEEMATDAQDIEEAIERIGNTIKQLVGNRKTLTAGIESLKARLAGSIECPSCGHEFVLADQHFDVNEGRKTLCAQETELSELNNNIEDQELDLETKEQCRTGLRMQTRELDNEKQQWENRMAKAKRDLEAVEYELEGAKFNRNRIAEYITGKQTEIDGLRRRVFDEAFGILEDAAKKIDRRKQAINEEIRTTETSIDTIQKNVKELMNSSDSEMIEKLKESLASYISQSQDALCRKEKAEYEYRRLVEQQQLFISFKTHLANTRIEALNRMANEILEEIGSDIRISLSGYTQLKSGSVREKISATLLRDGIDCGSFGKFSAGEAARVHLALILSMQKLINANCEDGKGLNLLCLDEIMDAVDFEGLGSIFTALNRMKVTAIVVSHGQTSEQYPYKLTIVKENGQSTIRL